MIAYYREQKRLPYRLGRSTTFILNGGRDTLSFVITQQSGDEEWGHLLSIGKSEGLFLAVWYEVKTLAKENAAVYFLFVLGLGFSLNCP